ncbi:MAG TPA: hypothetical protein VMN38_01165 [Sphingomicrobium sp.]|nr:hypothetical protein [Sphingomicrobium sp.]
MLRRLLHPGAILALWLTACSPAEPPLLVDGNQAPAKTIAQEPSGETLRNSSGNVALRR